MFNNCHVASINRLSRARIRPRSICEQARCGVRILARFLFPACMLRLPKVIAGAWIPVGRENVFSIPAVFSLLGTKRKMAGRYGRLETRYQGRPVRDPGSGGNSSAGYRKKKDDRTALLKAIDLSQVMRKPSDPMCTLARKFTMISKTTTLRKHLFRSEGCASVTAIRVGTALRPKPSSTPPYGS